MIDRVRSPLSSALVRAGLMLACGGLSVSCAPTPPLGATSASTTQATWASLEPSNCLPGRFVGTLAEPASPCPAAGKGWRVYKHRTGVEPAPPGAPDGGVSNAHDQSPDAGWTPTTTLVAATCSYVWIAGGAADSQALPSSAPGWLQPLCVDEPPIPETLQHAACPAGLQIGIRPRCQPVAGWDVKPLFPGKSGELEHYCQYTARPPGAGDAWSDAPSIPILGDADISELPPGLHTDCAVVGGLASADDRPAIEAAFQSAAESLPALPLVGGAQPTHVRVAVVDSALDRTDDGLPGIGRASHGRAMGVIVDRLACPTRDGTSACAVDVQNQPALWLTRTAQGFRLDRRGGFFGTQGQLAAAIVDAVDSAPSGTPLILNVSLGWAPSFGGGEAAMKDFSPPVRAVYAAIEYARCRGALVIAAAGNASGRPATPLGPLLPGGWETRPAPTVDRCYQLGVVAPTTPGAGRPLVHAAAGVDALDRPLFNAPLRGRSVLAAVAANAAVDDPAPANLQPRGVLTGSSIAAAVTSATAAVAWAYHPTTPGDEIIDGIYDSGVDLQLAADFCFGAASGAACPNIHRVSICRTVRAACRISGTGCDSVPSCLTTGVLTAPADLPDQAAMHANPCSQPRTGNLCVSTGTPLSRDAWQLGFVQRQPTDPICTVCTLAVGPRRLDLDTNPLTSALFFTTQGVGLWDDLGSLWIDTHADWHLQFTGGTDFSSGIDLSLTWGKIYWAYANFSYGQYDIFWNWYQTVEGQWLFLSP